MSRQNCDKVGDRTIMSEKKAKTKESAVGAKSGVLTKKKRIFDIIQIGQRGDLPSRVFDIFIVVAILLNITTLILETFDELEDYTTLFKVIESVTVFIFCVEYILRIWTA